MLEDEGARCDFLLSWGEGDAAQELTGGGVAPARLQH